MKLCTKCNKIKKNKCFKLAFFVICNECFRTIKYDNKNSIYKITT